MRNLIKHIIAITVLAVAAKAQVYVLDNFNSGTVTGAVNSSVTSWTGGAVVQNSTSITVGPSALDANGWTHTFGSLQNLSTYTYLSVTAQRDSGNAAANFALTLSDDNGTDFTTITIPTSSFALGSLTTVVMGFSWTGTGVSIADWNLGGGQASGSSAFRMTIDNVQLQTTSAIPEPSTYAALAGLAALGLVAWRRRRAMA